MTELRWWIFAVALLIVATMFARTFSYEPLVPQTDPLTYTLLWDRWAARTCLYGETPDHKLLCTPEEIMQWLSKR